MKASDYECEYCKTKFTREFDMTTHVGNCKHRTKKYKCPKCAKGFTTPYNMETHRNTVCIGTIAEGDAMKDLTNELNGMKAEINKLKDIIIALHEKMNSVLDAERPIIGKITTSKKSSPTLEKINSIPKKSTSKKALMKKTGPPPKVRPISKYESVKVMVSTKIRSDDSESEDEDDTKVICFVNLDCPESKINPFGDEIFNHITEKKLEHIFENVSTKHKYDRLIKEIYSNGTNRNVATTADYGIVAIMKANGRWERKNKNAVFTSLAERVKKMLDDIVDAKEINESLSERIKIFLQSANVSAIRGEITTRYFEMVCF